MYRIGVIRVSIQDLPNDLLGSMEPAGLMVLDRDRQRFRNCCHAAHSKKSIALSAILCEASVAAVPDAARLPLRFARSLLETPPPPHLTVGGLDVSGKPWRIHQGRCPEPLT